jgi:hypothetical protein
MAYQDRYKGRKLKDPPSYLGRFGLFILVGAAFAAFVGSLRGMDSSLCALATLCVVACKLLVELIATKAQLHLPERFQKLPLAAWLLFWLLPVPPLWFVLRTIWPKNADPNGAIGVFTMVCLVLYIPTILQVFKPIDKEATDVKGKSNAQAEDENSEKIDFNVDFNAPDQSQDSDTSEKIDSSEATIKPGKIKNKSRRKKK